MKRTLMVSVAALALAAGSTVALSQGPGGGNTPMANPSGGAATPGGAGVSPSEKDTHPGAKSGAPAKGAQERSAPDKQKSTQQAPQGGPAATTKQSQQEKSGQPATRQSQAPANEKPQQQGQAAPHQQPGQATPTQQSQGQPTTGAKQGAAERPMTSKSVSLTTEQKTTIRTKVLTSSAPRVTNVNFDIKVGIVVPRTVRVAPLPTTIIEIEPEWRGYMYFVYNDEIIVVEPGTLRIVAVLEV
jgi:hypothetical protein